eukprot:3940465-Rhodomonas_salina.1
MQSSSDVEARSLMAPARNRVSGYLAGRLAWQVATGHLAVRWVPSKGSSSHFHRSHTPSPPCRTCQHPVLGTRLVPPRYPLGTSWVPARDFLFSSFPFATFLIGHPVAGTRTYPAMHVHESMTLAPGSSAIRYVSTGHSVAIA